VSCPYCQGESGHYQVQQVRRESQYGWDRNFIRNANEEIFYKGKASRCIDCGEKVTSFVAHLKREDDNE